MEYPEIIQSIIDMARQNKKRIVLPETQDLRILEAASIIAMQDIASVMLIGKKQDIFDKCRSNDINIINDNITIVDPTEYYKKDEYIAEFFELRKHKGVTMDMASKQLEDYVYFGTMMVKCNDADGLVSGAIHTSSDTLRPALQIIKQRKDLGCASSFFLMQSPNKQLGSSGSFIFSDCGMIEFPTQEQLVDITKSSVNSFRLLVGDEPKVALLSYSTKGSARSEAVDKTQQVLKMLKEQNVDFDVDGELQLDAAIIPEVAQMKAGDSSVAGKANILIFPDIQAGNIGYKLAQRFGNAVALGPITQGLNKPVNDLSRGCNVQDIIGAVAITCVQANHN